MIPFLSIILLLVCTRVMCYTGLALSPHLTNTWVPLSQHAM